MKRAVLSMLLVAALAFYNAMLAHGGNVAAQFYWKGGLGFPGDGVPSWGKWLGRVYQWLGAVGAQEQ